MASIVSTWMIVTLMSLDHWTLVVSATNINKVVLISMDGFRYDYLSKANLRTPNFDKMIDKGVTMPYMQNIFVTNTFPSHYTMATGLYSESHGITANRMYDPVFNSSFSPKNVEPRWWEAGEPIWITAKKAGLKAGTYFWPGSDIPIHGVINQESRPYNKSVPFETRVRDLVKWMTKDDFDLGVVYFHEPDGSGHDFGPEAPEMNAVIENMDRILGFILKGLEDGGLKDKVNIILASDHGMTTCDLQNKIVDISEYVGDDILKTVVDEGTTSHMIPQEGKAQQLVDALSGIEHINVMLKENIPERFHFKNNRRVMPVFAYGDEGWTITMNKTLRRSYNYKGDHGHDNELANLHPFFVAMGPDFLSHKKVDPIHSVDIYPLICHLLDITPSANNGSLIRAGTLLKKTPNNEAVCSTSFSAVVVIIAAMVWICLVGH